jgi:ATP-dependent Clp protease ATP-binding subunit ClpC
MRYSVQTTELIRKAAFCARTMGHSFVGSVHLLLALAAQGGWPGQILSNAGADLNTLTELTRAIWGAGDPRAQLYQGFDPTAMRILRSAAQEASRGGCSQIGSMHVLLALLRTDHGSADQVLSLSGMDRNIAFTQAVEHMLWETEAGSIRKIRRTPI